MKLSFNELKVLVLIVSEHLSRQIIDDVLQVGDASEDDSVLRNSASESCYDEIRVLFGLLEELYKYRPLPF